MKNITKGQMEVKISEEMVKFEKEFMGRGPIETNTVIAKDAIFIRLKGVLTPAEVHVAQTSEGAELIKRTRFQFLNGARDILDNLVTRITGCKIISLHSDISTKNGERIIVFILDRNLESELKCKLS